MLWRSYLLRRLVMEWMTQRFPKWQAVDGAISKEGWKLITLLRLSPIIPWNVLNYALAVTGESHFFLLADHCVCLGA
jgi:uncharacterized membrane protein YdjX (TVP38/TMEM64 family)